MQEGKAQTDTDRRLLRVLHILSAAAKSGSDLKASTWCKRAGLSPNVLGNFIKADGARDIDHVTQKKLAEGIGIPLSALTLEMQDSDFRSLVAQMEREGIGGAPASSPRPRPTLAQQSLAAPQAPPPAPEPNVDASTILTSGLVGERDLPVYASAMGGKGQMLVTYDPIEWVKRPEPLMTVKGGFGMYVVGESMVPAYRPGDMILVHPTKPAFKDDDVLVVKKGAAGEREAMVKTLVAQDGVRVRVKQYNPPQEFDLPVSDVDGVFVVVGKYGRR